MQVCGWSLSGQVFSLALDSVSSCPVFFRHVTRLSYLGEVTAERAVLVPAKSATADPRSLIVRRASESGRRVTGSVPCAGLRSTANQSCGFISTRSGDSV